MDVNKSLEFLDVSNNQIGSVGFTAVLEALMSNNTLMRLNIALNNLKDRSPKVLCELLKVNKMIQSITLDAHTFKSNKQLKEIEKANKNSRLYFTLR